MRSLFFLFILFSGTINAQSKLIKNVNIVDVREGKLTTNMDVLIEKNKITDIGKSLKSPAGTITVDGRNKYLIPGLWDMHGHFLKRWDRSAPLYVANGITGVRDMATGLPLRDARQLRQEVLEGKKLGPRFITPGPLLDGPTSRFPQIAMAIDGKERAMKVADSLFIEGADFYKVYETLPRDAFYAIIEKGKEHHLTVTGHVPASITLDEAINSGMKSLEHLRFLSGDESIPKEVRDSVRYYFRTAMWDAANKDTQSSVEKNRKGVSLAIQYYKPDATTTKGIQIAQKNVWITPTMVQSTSGLRTREELLNNKNWDLMPSTIAAAWRHRVANDIRLFRFDIPEYTRLELKTIETFNKAGVRFLAGTDANDAFIGDMPGFGVHDEMQLFVQCGLTNLQALQTATINPAIFLDATDSLGTVEKNKIADLVLLDANPLENISNTRKIFGVVLNGRWLDRKKLDTLMEEVNALVKKL